MTEYISSSEIHERTGISHQRITEGKKYVDDVVLLKWGDSKRTRLRWPRKEALHHFENLPKLTQQQRAKAAFKLKRRKPNKKGGKGRKKHTPWRSETKDDEIRDKLLESGTQGELGGNQHDERLLYENRIMDWREFVNR